MELVNIIKRDGRVVPFDSSKITDAIRKAYVEVNASQVSGDDGRDIPSALCSEVIKNAEAADWSATDNIPTVEGIQDLVEKTLIANNYADVAKAYIVYRAHRTDARQMKSSLMRTFKEIAFTDSADSDLKRENGNIDGESSMGAMLRYGSEGSKELYKLFIMKPEHRKAYEDGWIHVHDLDFAPMGTLTCCQIDLLKLFKGGFHTGHGYLREPNSITSYAALAAIAIQSNQNDQHGGQSIVNFDYSMAEGVKKSFVTHYRENLRKAIKFKTGIAISKADMKDVLRTIKEEYKLQPTLEVNERYKEIELEKLTNRFNLDAVTVNESQSLAQTEAYNDTDRETFQAMEAFIHNLNTMHSRAGAQVPFSSINYGMDVSQEARMAIKNILLTTEKGLGNGETPIFP